MSDGLEAERVSRQTLAKLPLPDPDTLWFTRCPAPTAASVAIRQGWLAEEFAAEGISVRSLASARDETVKLSHYRHSQPNSFRFGGFVPPLVTASRGADLKIVGLSWPRRAAAVLTRPDLGLNRPEDLRGRRLSLPRRLNDSIDWWRATVLGGYADVLASAGLGLGDVELVEVAIERAYMEDASTGDGRAQSLWGARSQFAVQREEIGALVRGDVDAIYSDGAMYALVQAFLGLQPIPAAAAHGHPLILSVSGALLDARPDLVRRWLMRLLQAGPWAQANRDLCRRIIAADTGLPEELIETGYSPDVYGELHVSLDAHGLSLLRRRHDQLLQTGFLARPLDLDRLVVHGPLDDARASLALSQG
jgi:ABC-type nitrate/sulfonate/bicarbonate transport system substrate-binding protein